MLFIFDWDGTLCDSLDRIVASVQRAALDIDVPTPSSEKAKSVIGLGLSEALDSLFPGLDQLGRDKLIEAYKYHFVSLASEMPSRLYDGAIDTLNTLRNSGHKLAIATGKSRLGLTNSLAELNLTQYFDATRCADETRSKPHPLMLEQLLDEMGFAAAQAVMIGDTEFDLEMANQLNMPTVAVSYGAHDLFRLEKCKPGFVVDNLVEMLGKY